jgi:hypothetical protein
MSSLTIDDLTDELADTYCVPSSAIRREIHARINGRDDESVYSPSPTITAEVAEHIRTGMREVHGIGAAPLALVTNTARAARDTVQRRDDVIVEAVAAGQEKVKVGIAAGISRDTVARLVARSSEASYQSDVDLVVLLTSLAAGSDDAEGLYVAGLLCWAFQQLRWPERDHTVFTRRVVEAGGKPAQLSGLDEDSLRGEFTTALPRALKWIKREEKRLRKAERKYGFNVEQRSEIDNALVDLPKILGWVANGVPISPHHLCRVQ